MLPAVASTGLPGAIAGLRTTGWTVLDWPDCSVPGLTSLARHFGRLSIRDGGKALWPVRPSTADPAATYSLRAGSAALHTDAAWWTRPEDVVLLACVRPARDGGDSLVLTRTAAERALLATRDGTYVHRLLHDAAFSWRTPANFERGTSDRHPVFGATLRWRGDNVDAIDDEHLHAARLFERALARDARPIRVPLRCGQVLAIDNTRVLHGRSHFVDPDRLLVRARVWSRA